jgi:hypothetical protein
MPKLSKIINYPLGLLGLKLSRLPNGEGKQNAIQDINADKDFMNVYNKIREYTMAGYERCYGLYNAVRYIIEKGIKGDFAECGVWKGGSVMLMAYTLQAAGVTDRKIYLYDTFQGMAKPGEYDGEKEKKEWERNKVNEQINKWCLSYLEEVQSNIAMTGYPNHNIIYIKGRVEETIPSQMPGNLSLLRLDTDWYASTKHELSHLFPLLEKDGILILDDYGAWQGARKAADEYFAANGIALLNRLDFTGRLVIK